MAYLWSGAKIELRHVPYEGGGPAVLDAIAGHVQGVLVPVPTVFGHVKSGRLRALGVTSGQRSSLVPDLPTISEAGVPGFEYGTRFGLLAPAGTPKPNRLRDCEVAEGDRSSRNHCTLGVCRTQPRQTPDARPPARKPKKMR
jgi:tripartite-type tricarboxylate transporter receptor subunit TctC